MFKLAQMKFSFRHVPGSRVSNTPDTGIHRIDERETSPGLSGICLAMIVTTLLAGNLFAASPAGEGVEKEKQQPVTQVKPAENSKPKSRAPAASFTPSEKVGADSAVSFPVDI